MSSSALTAFPLQSPACPCVFTGTAFHCGSTASSPVPYNRAPFSTDTDTAGMAANGKGVADTVPYSDGSAWTEVQNGQVAFDVFDAIR